MRTQRSRRGLLGVASTLILVALFALVLRITRPQLPTTFVQSRTVQGEGAVTLLEQIPTVPMPQVVVGTPEFYGESVRERYSYRNGFENRTNLSGPFTLYLIDNETGQEMQLGNMGGGTAYSGQNEEYMLWHFLCVTECDEVQDGLHAYAFATGVDHFISPLSSSGIHPQIFGEWIAFGRERPQAQMATLYAGNIQTHEIITLTETLWAPNARVYGYFGISERLAAWYDPPDGIIVYDLQHHHELMRIPNLFSAFHESSGEIYGVSAGETVVTWNRAYGYDLVTQSYFSLSQVIPSDGAEPYMTMSRIHEANRVLSWSFTYEDGTQRHVRAPLLDATPSTAPCIADQNLVQNGDLESTTDHSLWQQSGSPTNLLVNDPPPGLANGGQWAIRLGRFNNAQQAIQQTVAIPSSVNGLTLTFAVRVYSWDLWGGDRLQVDLVDPLNGQSLLATPVQWTNVQLASGDWIPMQVAIQDWPGIDTPVTLVFRTQTDWAFPTDFTIDQVNLLTHCL